MIPFFLVAEGWVLQEAKPAGVLEPMSATELGSRKIHQFVHTQHIYSSFNSLGVCNFAAAPYSAFTFPLLTDAVSSSSFFDLEPLS